VYQLWYFGGHAVNQRVEQNLVRFIMAKYASFSPRSDTADLRIAQRDKPYQLHYYPGCFMSEGLLFVETDRRVADRSGRSV
jgi:hypothetical protein